MSLASSIKFIYYTVYTASPEDPFSTLETARKMVHSTINKIVEFLVSDEDMNLFIQNFSCVLIRE